jgi:hypothetical protein
LSASDKIKEIPQGNKRRYSDNTKEVDGIAKDVN